MVEAFPALTSASAVSSGNEEERKTNTDETDPDAMETNEGEVNAEYTERIKKLRKVLVEGFDIDLTLNFLYKQCQTDLLILGNIKSATENRGAVLHNATVVAHAYMNCGTTQDKFLRDNLDWLAKASNWAKFTAVSSIGVVHKGHLHESMALLQVICLQYSNFLDNIGLLSFISFYFHAALSAS